MSQRFEGRNLEEALQNAAQALGVERWQLAHHVLLEKRGFLGGFKRVVIEASVDEAAAPPPAPIAPLPEPASDSPPRAERPQRARGQGGTGGRRDRQGGRGGRKDGGRNRDQADFRTGDFETFLGDVPEQTPESEGAKAAREWCENALRLARVDVVARTEENDTQIVIRLYGTDSERLTDRHGELLDAVQVLANKALVGRSLEKEIELDSEEFKERRVEDLERRAFAVADRVRRGGREELLPAMSPIERRIVHLALQNDEDVTTESRGEGFYKRVAIVLRPQVERADESNSVEPAPES